MNRKFFYANILPFLPLLVLYVVIILMFSSNKTEGDELRYIRYATNILHGFFADENNPSLRNGPGYPLILAPFLALNAGLTTIKFLNAIALFIGVVYFKKTLELFIKRRYAIIIAYLLGLYPPLIRWMPLVYSESFTFLIICGLIFHVCKLYQKKKLDWKHLLVASIYLGFLVLFKIIFIQVIILSIALILGQFIFYRNKKTVKISLVILGSFIWIMPYVLYAYSITGKFLYLGTGGGEILYFRSTPYADEWGNWFTRENVLNGNANLKGESDIYNGLAKLSENHRDFFLELEPLTNMERDSVLKSKAIQNMRNHPGKYLKNTISNITRLIFHYPFSYRQQDMAAFGYLIPNMVILFLWFLSLYPFLLAKRRMPFEIKAVMVFLLIYGCGIALLGGRGRHFIIMVPSFILFFVFVFANLVKIKIVKKEHEN